MGIDQYKIYNINKRVNLRESIGILEKIFNNPITGTKNPQRLIEDIV